MFVVRPHKVSTTPRILAQELGFTLRKYHNPLKPNRIYDFKRDFFVALPSIVHTRNAPPEYPQAATFFGENKYRQRLMLAVSGWPVPMSAINKDRAKEMEGDRFVVRHFRHQKGEFYKVTESNQDFVEGKEYISEVFPKTREYRVIVLFGEPVVLLRKKPPEGAQPWDAWNHAHEAVFQSVKDVQGGRLAQHTDFFERLKTWSVAKGCHICAMDVLYTKKKYVICEVNSCPSLTIDDNRAKIVEIIKGRQ
jgi:hypothetical protein